MAQQRRLVIKGEPADVAGPRFHRDQAVGHIVHVIPGVDPARNSEPQQLKIRRLLLAGGGIAPQQQGAYLHPAHAPFQIELAGERMGRELLGWNMGQQLFGIHKHRMAAGGVWIGMPASASRSPR